MDHLTKQQVTLLCLLIALFTSIATSVVTASLMDETSTGISQTIYKVVERTIEEVSSTKGSVVVKNTVENDKKDDEPKNTNVQIPLDQIVEKANKSLVGIWSKSGRDNGTFVSIGVVVGNKNAVIAFNGTSIFENVTYIVRFADGKEVQMIKQRTNIPLAMAVLNYGPNAEARPNITGITTGSLTDQKLGGNVIAIGSKLNNNVVSTGIITEFPLDKGIDGSNKETAVTDIKLSAPSSGWILFDTSGNVIGLIAESLITDKGARYLGISTVKTATSDAF